MKREDDDLRAEIAAAAADGALDPAERAGLAREAIGRADRVSAPRSRLPLLLVPAAALVLAAFLLSFTGTPERTELAARGIAAEREANLRALESEETVRRLSAAGEQGHAVVSGGRLVGVGNLATLLAVAAEEDPRASHRFVFRVGTQGDVRLKTGTHRGPAVGSAFLKLAEILENEERWPVEVADGKRMKMTVGEPGMFTTPNRSRAVPFLLDPAFTGEILLPEDLHYPLYEIPGIATVVDENGEERVYRRYLVGFSYSLKPHGRFKLEEVFEGAGEGQWGCTWWGDHEAIGTAAPEPAWPRIGDRLVPPADQRALDEAFTTKRPLLEIRGEIPGGVFADTEVKDLLDKFVPAIGESAGSAVLLVLRPAAPPGGASPVHRYPTRAAHGAGFGFYEWSRLPLGAETSAREVREFLTESLRAKAGPARPLPPTPEWVPIPESALEILKYEVTNAMWSAWLASRGETAPPDPSASPSWWNRPVTGITYDAADSFCREYLAKLPGCTGARLPTPHEWSAAAGNSLSSKEYDWGPGFFGGVGRNLKPAGLGRPCAVTTFAKTDRTPWGVVGLTGNVAEIVTGPARIGGSYLDDNDAARSGNEVRIERNATFPDVGFRAVRPAED